MDRGERLIKYNKKGGTMPAYSIDSAHFCKTSFLVSE